MLLPEQKRTLTTKDWCIKRKLEESFSSSMAGTNKKVWTKGDPLAGEPPPDEQSVLERLRSLESHVAVLEQDRQLDKQKLEEFSNTVKRLTALVEGKPPRYADVAEGVDSDDHDGPQLLSAFYHNADVTRVVSQMITEGKGKLQFERAGGIVNRKLGLDPAFGVEKVLCLTWIDRRGNFHRQAILEKVLDKGRAYQIW